MAAYRAVDRLASLELAGPSPAASYLPSLEEVEHAARCAMAGLYLAGAPRGFEVPRSASMDVLTRIRSEGASLRTAARFLKRAGLSTESLCLETPGLLAWAEDQVLRGKVLTRACASYPRNWARRFGPSGPSALWMRGSLPSPPYLAVVGSRHVEARVRAFSVEVGREAFRLDYAVVSGAAPGCDRAAVGGAARQWKEAKGIGSCPVVQILPCGLALRQERFPGCVLSPFSPNELFSGPNAMQRNALIYAMGEAAVVVHARFGEGGTWRGAVEAHRRRLCRLLVRNDGSPAARALIGLGGIGMEEVGQLRNALQATSPQGELSF